MRRALIALLLAATTVLCCRRRRPARLSINARDTDLADVIALIARQSGINIVRRRVGSSPAHWITFRLHDVDEAGTALATLAQAYDLQTHRDGNIVFVRRDATA